MHSQTSTSAHTLTRIEYTQYLQVSALLAAIYKNGHIQWVYNLVRLNQISVPFTDLIEVVIFRVPQHKAAGLIESVQS